MVEPINLRQFRKRKIREEKEQVADANRKLHGISSGLKKRAKSENASNTTKLDGKRLNRDD